MDATLTDWRHGKYLFALAVLLSICSLLTDPNPDDPLVPDIAHVRSRKIRSTHSDLCTALQDGSCAV